MSIIFIAALAVLQVLIVFLSFVIYKVFAAAFGIGGSTLLVFFVALSFTFIVASVLASRYKNWLVRWFHFASTCWFAFIGPLFCGCIAFLLIENIALVFGWQIIPSVAGWLSFGGAVLLYIYGIGNARITNITRISVKIPDCPEWWHGKKIVFISDTHFGNEYGAHFAAKIVQKMSSCAPQAVFIGGDFFDGVRCDPDAILSPFRKLSVPYGIYFSSGNHEYYGDSELFFDAVRRAGIIILKNEKKTIEGMNFFGVDFKDAGGRKDFENVCAEMEINPAKANVLIKHIPDNLDIAERAGVSLELSGHTHHGQIFPLSYLTRAIFEGYDYGLKQFGKMAVYTSSGAGASPTPFRVGTHSEIVCIEFE